MNKSSMAGHNIIKFASGNSAVGTVLAARSQNGVCMIDLGDDIDVLLASLKSRFPSAKLAPISDRIHGFVAQLIDYTCSRPCPDMPLDFQGTDFQLKVWRTIQLILPGQTSTYSEVGKIIDHPQGARAVARACAANPLALVVPCHRVVRSDGSPSGYRWGLERKQLLLSLEAQAVSIKTL